MPELLGDYTATWDPVAGSLSVEATFAAVPEGALQFESGAERFASEVVVGVGDRPSWQSVPRHGAVYTAAACATARCRLRYRIALRAAAEAIGDPDHAALFDDVVEAPPSTWLLAPARAHRPHARLRFRVITPPGSRFVTGVFRVAGAKDTWDLRYADLWTSPYSAFGAFDVRPIAVRGGVLELAIGPGASAATAARVTAWVSDGARAIEAYYRRFPMPGALVLVLVTPGHRVRGGRTLSGGGGTVMVQVGRDVDERTLRRDWVLVHELVHLTFPWVAPKHIWAQEGIATYVEPFARVRAGLLEERVAWAELVAGLAKGLPAAGDQGLDVTHTWGRTYWGGALFWFLSDLEIRQRTAGRFGLEHALRAINDAPGGNNASRWELASVLAVGDHAVGVAVLSELYAAMRTSPHPVELAPLFRRLGVKVTRDGSEVAFDERAPGAAIRRAMTHGD